MGDVRELGQHGMSRLPWIPWDTSCIPPKNTHTVHSPSVKHLDQLKRAEMGGRSVSLPGILDQPKEKSSGLLISDDDVKKTNIK